MAALAFADEAAPVIGEKVGTVVAEKIANVTKSVDALAQIGGLRGGSYQQQERIRKLADIEQAIRANERRLDQIAKNTFGLL